MDWILWLDLLPYCFGACWNFTLFSGLDTIYLIRNLSVPALKSFSFIVFFISVNGDFILLILHIKTLVLPSTPLLLSDFNSTYEDIHRYSVKIFPPNFRIYPDPKHYSTPPAAVLGEAIAASVVIYCRDLWWPSYFPLCSVQSLRHWTGRTTDERSFRYCHSLVWNPQWFLISLKVAVKVSQWLYTSAFPWSHYLWHLCHPLLCSSTHEGFLAVPSETNTLLCILALTLPGMSFPRYLQGPLSHPAWSLLNYTLSSGRSHLTTYSVSPSSHI